MSKSMIYRMRVQQSPSRVEISAQEQAAQVARDRLAGRMEELFRWTPDQLEHQVEDTVFAGRPASLASEDEHEYE